MGLRGPTTPRWVFSPGLHPSPWAILFPAGCVPEKPTDELKVTQLPNDTVLPRLSPSCHLLHSIFTKPSEVNTISRPMLCLRRPRLREVKQLVYRHTAVSHDPKPGLIPKPMLPKPGLVAFSKRTEPVAPTGLFHSAGFQWPSALASCRHRASTRSRLPGPPGDSRPMTVGPLGMRPTTPLPDALGWSPTCSQAGEAQSYAPGAWLGPQPCRGNTLPEPGTSVPPPHRQEETPRRQARPAPAALTQEAGRPSFTTKGCCPLKTVPTGV